MPKIVRLLLAFFPFIQFNIHDPLTSLLLASKINIVTNRDLTDLPTSDVILSPSPVTNLSMSPNNDTSPVIVLL